MSVYSGPRFTACAGHDAGTAASALTTSKCSGDFRPEKSTIAWWFTSLRTDTGWADWHPVPAIATTASNPSRGHDFGLNNIPSIGLPLAHKEQHWESALESVRAAEGLLRFSRAGVSVNPSFCFLPGELSQGQLIGQDLAVAPRARINGPPAERLRRQIRPHDVPPALGDEPEPLQFRVAPLADEPRFPLARPHLAEEEPQDRVRPQRQRQREADDAVRRVPRRADPDLVRVVLRLLQRVHGPPDRWDATGIGGGNDRPIGEPARLRRRERGRRHGLTRRASEYARKTKQNEQHAHHKSDRKNSTAAVCECLTGALRKRRRRGL